MLNEQPFSYVVCTGYGPLWGMRTIGKLGKVANGMNTKGYPVRVGIFLKGREQNRAFG